MKLLRASKAACLLVGCLLTGSLMVGCGKTDDVAETTVVETLEVVESSPVEESTAEENTYNGEIYVSPTHAEDETVAAVGDRGRRLDPGTYIAGYGLPITDYYLYTSGKPDIICITLKEHKKIQPGNTEKVESGLKDILWGDEDSGYCSTLRLEENAILITKEMIALEPISDRGFVYHDINMEDCYFEGLSQVDLLALANAGKIPEIRGYGTVMGLDKDIAILLDAEQNFVAIKTSEELKVGENVEYIGRLAGAYKVGDIQTGLIVAEIEKETEKEKEKTEN